MEKYSDIDIFLQKNDLTGDAPLKTCISSIHQSLTNIALTKKSERMFLPTFGTDLLEALQENLLQLEYNILKEVIIAQLESQETRVTINNLEIEKNSDIFNIKIYYTTKDGYNSLGILNLTVNVIV
jgi:phage baseplate assembly protein W